MSDERSPDGTAILRHGADARSGAAAHDGMLADAVEKHLAEHVGPAATVFHELVSDLVHIDVHVIAPTAERPTWVLFTTGMSARPMTVPPGSGADEHAELVMSLPAHWLDAGPRGDGTAPPPIPPERWWPIGVMKYLARLPHVYGTWLGFGHTVDDGGAGLQARAWTGRPAGPVGGTRRVRDARHHPRAGGGLTPCP